MRPRREQVGGEMFHRSRILFALLALSSLAFAALTCGCSSRVDLDAARNHPVIASDDPDVLGVVSEAVQQIAVDEQRLYWSGSWGEEVLNGTTAHADLRSCNKGDCVNTLVTYDGDSSTYAIPFGVLNGRIYWLHGDWNDWPRLDLRSCDIAGCVGAPQIVLRGSHADAPQAIAFGPDAIYLYVHTSSPSLGSVDPSWLYRISLSRPEAAPVVIDEALAGRVLTMTVQDDYLYWLEQDESAPYSTTVQRLRTDGTGDPQEVAGPLHSTSSNLASDGQYVYWSQGTLYGAIARCPLEGCADPASPELFAEPVRSPQTLRVDGANLYWVHDTAWNGYATSSCSLAACKPSELVAGSVAVPNALAIDDQYVYTATSDQDPNPSYPMLNFLQRIQRFSKFAR